METPGVPQLLARISDHRRPHAAPRCRRGRETLRRGSDGVGHEAQRWVVHRAQPRQHHRRGAGGVGRALAHRRKGERRCQRRLGVGAAATSRGRRRHRRRAAAVAALLCSSPFSSAVVGPACPRPLRLNIS
jgi:hypothetical protein